jgi:hypothetical protein
MCGNLDPQETKRFEEACPITLEQADCRLHH